MTEADRIFARFPEFIKEYIFARGWEELRPLQISAAHTVFDSDRDLLLCSSTASGKTEAAFFPLLTELTEHPSDSIAVLYIAPLKSLINDQFGRMEELLREGGIPVTHWHGDVAASQKTKLLRQPSGILQITPESLESMLVNRPNDIPRLFCDLRCVVLDEIHTLTGTDRGNQILCQLCRIGEKIGYHPRRIGLSATVGDKELAARWLSAGDGHEVDIPDPGNEKLRWRLGLEHFYIAERPSNESENDDARPKNTKPGFSDAEPFHTVQTEVSSEQVPKETAEENGNSGENGQSVIDAGYEYLYDCVKDKRALVFSNSREETEYVTATLRQIARNRQEDDVFYIHHGNLSAALREEAEMKLKQEEGRAVCCATVTMELGIDIGKLERVAQVGAPTSVTSFLQRLGRSGRRGEPPEMMMVFREEDPLPNTPLPLLIPWELLRAVAVIRLYLEERFIEPPRFKHLPFSLAFQQTLSILSASGELTPKALAQKLLSLPPFADMPKESYRELLISMIRNDFIEQTEEGGLIVGLGGEKLTSSFKFYAVFQDSEDYTVREGSDEIGTISSVPPVGDRFALAGKVWEVTEIDKPRRLIFVKGVNGKMEISWPGDYGEIHTKILKRMKDILLDDTQLYPYLKPNAKKRLSDARRIARAAGMHKRSLIHLGGYTWCLFPWLGTRGFRTLRRFLSANASVLGISNIEFEGCCYLLFKLDDNDGARLVRMLNELLEKGEMAPEGLVFASETPVFDKYDGQIPPPLLRQAYARDRLCPEEAAETVRELFAEYGC